MNILEEANKIVNLRAEEKEREYGPMDESMQKAADVASLLTNKDITAKDFYLCMVALKISRLAFNTKDDTFVDLVGYLAGLHNHLNK